MWQRLRVHSALKIGVRGTFCARPVFFKHGCFSFKKFFTFKYTSHWHKKQTLRKQWEIVYFIVCEIVPLMYCALCVCVPAEWKTMLWRGKEGGGRRETDKEGGGGGGDYRAVSQGSLISKDESVEMTEQQQQQQQYRMSSSAEKSEFFWVESHIVETWRVELWWIQKEQLTEQFYPASTGLTWKRSWAFAVLEFGFRLKFAGRWRHAVILAWKPSQFCEFGLEVSLH